MQQRRARYFQMRRWEGKNGGDLAADCSYVRVCGASDDPRFTRMMQGYAEDRMAADAAGSRPGRRSLDPDLEAVFDPRGDSAWD